jgi:hypothetical protein
MIAAARKDPNINNNMLLAAAPKFLSLSWPAQLGCRNCFSFGARFALLIRCTTVVVSRRLTISSSKAFRALSIFVHIWITVRSQSNLVDWLSKNVRSKVISGAVSGSVSGKVWKFLEKVKVNCWVTRENFIIFPSFFTERERKKREKRRKKIYFGIFSYLFKASASVWRVEEKSE